MQIRLSIIVFALYIVSVNSEFKSITFSNYDEVLKFSKLEFVSFTADWCPFSRELLKSFRKAAAEYPNQYPCSSVMWANIDCVRQDDICEKHNIRKFPTMKVLFYGYTIAEYRGSRFFDDLMRYIHKFDDLQTLLDMQEIESITLWQDYAKPMKGNVIVWFPQNSAPFELILRAAALEHDKVVVIGPKKTLDLQSEEHMLLFSSDGSHFKRYNGSISSFDDISKWLTQNSHGIVRELTFDNSEALVDEGKPFLVLFRDNSTDLDQKFREAISRELNSEMFQTLNPLIINGIVISYPLYALGVKLPQLPVLVIDEFVHMYNSGLSKDEIFAEGNIRKKNTEDLEKIVRVESAFKKMEPSKKRYSFKQEL
ncbi:unnamed protein product [Caenorhabditis bovis]|uniref:Thioredoxin domain-containing protein n=1 Tax=Caenorhabditis bovis TaxID=2654633 RepID=A0A8S1F555_9PELO|nr:unnamed protein product [Caenorhabditis bovis]